MVNIKKFEEYGLVDEGFIYSNKFTNMIYSKISSSVKKIISKKTDEEKLIIFEKLLTLSNMILNRNFNRYYIISMLSSISLSIISRVLDKFDYVQNMQWIFIVFFWILLLSSRPLRKKILNLISKSKNEYLRNKLSDIEKILDPLCEEDWGDDENKNDLILKKLNALEKNRVLYDVELSFKETDRIYIERNYNNHLFILNLKFLFAGLVNLNNFILKLSNNKIIIEDVEFPNINKREYFKFIKEEIKNDSILYIFKVKFIKK